MLSLLFSKKCRGVGIGQHGLFFKDMRPGECGALCLLTPVQLKLSHSMLANQFFPFPQSLWHRCWVVSPWISRISLILFAIRCVCRTARRGTGKKHPELHSPCLARRSQWRIFTVYAVAALFVWLQLRLPRGRSFMPAVV